MSATDRQGRTDAKQDTGGFGSLLSFEDLERLYRLRSRSMAFDAGALIAAVGLCGAALSLAFAYMPGTPILGIDPGKLLSPLLMPSLALLSAGALLLILDACKRRWGYPRRFEVRRDFIRYMLQEGLFPQRGFTKEQFRCRVKTHSGGIGYEILFNLDCPGISYNSLSKHMANIAEAFGCGDTFDFSENKRRASMYARGYRYRLDLIVLGLEAAFNRAQKRRKP
jgi:hypothetical protein